MLNWGQIPDCWLDNAISMLSGPESSAENRTEIIRRLRAARTSARDTLEVLLGVWDADRLWSAFWLHDLGCGTAAFGDPWLNDSVDRLTARTAADKTMLAVDDWCRQTRPRTVQGMMSLESTRVWGDLLCEHGWVHEGGLDYLGRTLSADDVDQVRDTDRSRRFELIEATRWGIRDLDILITRTQQDSLDCRYLEGRRSVAEMISVFRTATRTGDSLWLVLLESGAPIGCLLFGLHDSVTAEWVYLGLVPERRRQGIGHYLAARGLQLARRMGIRSVLVAVDSINLPASHLYRRLGFAIWDRRRVFLRWNGSASDFLETA